MGKTKTRKGRRTVPLPRRVCTELGKHLEWAVRVLLIEDSAPIVRAVRRGLEEAGVLACGMFLLFEGTLLRGSGRPPTSGNQSGERFRRPGLNEDMSDKERKLAEAWGVTVGLTVPGS